MDTLWSTKKKKVNRLKPDFVLIFFGAEIIELALQEHNKYRRLHGVPDLKWDVTVSLVAYHAFFFLSN